MSEEPRPRGLPSIEEARQLRATRIRWPPAKFWAWSGLILAVTLILHWKHIAGRERERAPSAAGEAARRRERARASLASAARQDRAAGRSASRRARAPRSSIATRSRAGTSAASRASTCGCARSDAKDAASIRKGAEGLAEGRLHRVPGPGAEPEPARRAPSASTRGTARAERCATSSTTVVCRRSRTTCVSLTAHFASSLTIGCATFRMRRTTFACGSWPRASTTRCADDHADRGRSADAGAVLPARARRGPAKGARSAVDGGKRAEALLRRRRIRRASGSGDCRTGNRSFAFGARRAGSSWAAPPADRRAGR